MDLYETPWQETPRYAWFCSDDCEFTYVRLGPSPYRGCNACCRDVREVHPANGLHYQFREHPALGDACLRCYEREVLEHGQPREDYEGDNIRGGMFFSTGNAEPRAAGFEEVRGFADYFVGEREHVQRFNRRALELADAGNKVLTAFERIGLWIEGYITLMAAPRARDPAGQ